MSHNRSANKSTMQDIETEVLSLSDKKNHDNFNAIRAAALTKNQDRLKEIQKYCPNLDVQITRQDSKVLTRTPISQLASEGEDEATSFLLNLGASANEAIAGYASVNNHEKVDELLTKTKLGFFLGLEKIYAKIAAIAGYAIAGNEDKVNELLSDPFFSEKEFARVAFPAAMIGFAYAKKDKQVLSLIEKLQSLLPKGKAILIAISAGTNAFAIVGNQQEVNKLSDKLAQKLKHDMDTGIISSYASVNNSFRLGVIKMYEQAGYDDFANQLKYDCIYDAAKYQDKEALEEALNEPELILTTDINITKKINGILHTPASQLASEGDTNAVNFLMPYGANASLPIQPVSSNNEEINQPEFDFEDKNKKADQNPLTTSIKNQNNNERVNIEENLIIEKLNIECNRYQAYLEKKIKLELNYQLEALKSFCKKGPNCSPVFLEMPKKFSSAIESKNITNMIELMNDKDYKTLFPNKMKILSYRNKFNALKQLRDESFNKENLSSAEKIHEFTRLFDTNEFRAILKSGADGAGVRFLQAIGHLLRTILSLGKYAKQRGSAKFWKNEEEILIMNKNHITRDIKIPQSRL